MKKTILLRFSILGMMLVLTSVVIGAMFPKKSTKANFRVGSLTRAGTSRVTCSQTNAVAPGQCCNASTLEGSVTTIAPEIDSNSVSSEEGDGGDGQDNTTDDEC